MSNSSLVSFVKYSPFNSGERKHAIDRITPHCVVGQCAIEALGDLFCQPGRNASSNYGIDKDGRIGLFVDEDCVSWCSGGDLLTEAVPNDQRAVTVECASDLTAPWAFRPIVYERLVELCTDICRRNGKKKLLWLEDRDYSLAYHPKADEMVLTVHRWFANKSCPGDWMMERMGDLAQRVTDALSPAEYDDGEGGTIIEPKPTTPSQPWYTEYMAWAKENGIINDGRPRDNLTRAEMAAVSKRLYELILRDVDERIKVHLPEDEYSIGTKG